jgi:hypothetical protein
MSPNAAAFANVPTDAFGPDSFAHASAFSLFASRDPILTSWPSARKPLPSALPTSHVPKIPIFISSFPDGWLRSRPECLSEVARELVERARHRPVTLSMSGEMAAAWPAASTSMS